MFRYNNRWKYYYSYFLFASIKYAVAPQLTDQNRTDHRRRRDKLG
jgi:hypothetical protein